MINKKTDSSEWYNEIIELSGLVDKRYPVKGMNVLPPYGFKVVKLVDDVIRESVNAHGLQEVQFPLLISRSQLSVEFEHVKGFESQVFWVTKGGNDKLEDEMALRPTSEAAMYSMFPLWIRTHGDLPLKIYQIVSTYRYETKHTRAFIRDREIHFFEAHTAHVDYDDAERQMDDYISMMHELSKALCLPFTINRRPDWDKFPGAMYSLAFDLILSSGRSLQIGTIHQYGENFSKNYGISYSDVNGERKYVSQTTYGMSSRLIAAMIFTHGDDKGLILPPEVAPVQVVIVPIPGENTNINSFCTRVMDMLKNSGIRASLDDRDNYTPGFKYNDWEMKGVPLRIEIGSRETENSYLTIVPRHTGRRSKIDLQETVVKVREALDIMQIELKKRAEETVKKMTFKATSLEEAKSLKGMIQIAWCGSKECSDKIEAETELVCLGTPHGKKGSGRCVVCGSPGFPANFARTY